MRSMTPRTSRTYRLDAELVAGLEAIKDRDGVPVSTQVRRAIRAWLEKGCVLKAARKRAGTRTRA